MKSFSPKRLLRQLLRRYLIWIQFCLFGFAINDVIGNVVRLTEIQRWLNTWRCAVHRVVSSQNRPGELAEAGRAWRTDLCDRFGACERRGCRRWHCDSATWRRIRVHHRVHAAATWHTSLVLGIFLGMQDLQAPVSPAQEMSHLFHRRTIHLPVRFDLQN